MINADHITVEIKQILTEVLGLGKERLNSLTRDSILLGNIPELDSVAVVTIILTIEKKFSITIKDDEISTKTFETLGSLANFVVTKLADQQNYSA